MRVEPIRSKQHLKAILEANQDGNNSTMVPIDDLRTVGALPMRLVATSMYGGKDSVWRILDRHGFVLFTGISIHESIWPGLQDLDSTTIYTVNWAPSDIVWFVPYFVLFSWAAEV